MPLSQIAHADAVRDASPQLTRAEFVLLAARPYETPRPCSGPALVLAQRLAKRKLLEADPSAPTWFRRTDAGTEVLRAWRRAGWKP